MPDADKPAPRNDHPPTLDECETALALQFPPAAVQWFPAGPPDPGGLTPAVPRVADTHIQARLDYVFGKGGWSVEFRADPAAVVCRLVVMFPGAPDVVARAGIGRDPTAADAYGEAFRAAAGQLGIGRYLYAVPPHAVEFKGGRVPDPPKLRPEFLPPGWRPAGVELADAATRAAREFCDGNPGHTVQAVIGRFLKELTYYPDADVRPLRDVETRHVEAFVKRLAADRQKRDAARAADERAAALPRTGAELLAHLTRWETDLAKKKLCGLGELVAYVTVRGFGEKWGELPTWNAPAQIDRAVTWGEEFETEKKKNPTPDGARKAAKAAR
jgi:hypothetical protein